MKFGREYKDALANDEFPEAWKKSAIDYRGLKKCIRKVRQELEELGLDGQATSDLSNLLEHAGSVSQEDGIKPESDSATPRSHSTFSDDFTPQLRLLVDAQTGEPLDATLAPETRDRLRKLAKHELTDIQSASSQPANQVADPVSSHARPDSPEDDIPRPAESKWIQIPLHAASDFFRLLGPRMDDLEELNRREEAKLEDQILDLGRAVENVTEPVRDGFESRRFVSYRDLYYWREVFRLYMEKPIFYSEKETNGGAVTFEEAKQRLQAYDTRLRETGLMAKMNTPRAKYAASKFFKVNVRILKIMHFQEMNARAMTKILKKFDKQTNLEGSTFLLDLRKRHPALLTNSNNAAGGFANSIGKDMYAEIATKVLPVVPQLEDWTCPICYAVAWRPVNLGCCRSIFCLQCIVKLQDDGIERCPCCNKKTVLSADGRNLDFPTMDFLAKFFPVEVKKREKDHDVEHLRRKHANDFVKPRCALM